MKLNLGCNTRIREGYVNVDKDQYPGVDKVADVSKLPFPDNSADELYVSHILEHFGHTRTNEVLKEWYRVLKPGGILKIAVPDFARMIELYYKYGLCDFIVNNLWGDQGYEGANHYCGFDEPRLHNELKKAGFVDIARVENLPGHQKGECSANLCNMDLKPVSLNMVATKE